MTTKKKKKAKKATKKKRKSRTKELAEKEVRPSKLLAPAKSTVNHYDPTLEDFKDQSHLCVIPAKRPVGRPSAYEGRFCQMLIDHMAAGFSYESFAGLIAVAISTIYKWEKEHKQFSDAKQRGVAAALHWWENAAVVGMGMPTKQFNSTVWSRNMNARFPKQGWRGDSAPMDEGNDDLEFVVEFGT